jgi:DNA-binding response OmpR family regulator
LMVTAYDAINTSRSLALGVNNFVRKPIEFEQLLTKVATLLKDKQPGFNG